MTTRRRFLISSAAASAALLPRASLADPAAGVFQTGRGPITVTPIRHASFVMETPVGMIFVDPVGDAASYDAFPRPDLILITHEHAENFDLPLINRIFGEATRMFTNPAVDDLLPDDLKPYNRPLPNGEIGLFDALSVEAVPAYNLSTGATPLHPQGRGNGYILNFFDFRVYLSGDTGDTPELRGLSEIDLAFVAMNREGTMPAATAAEAVNAFAPRFVYPYAYGDAADLQGFEQAVDREIRVLHGAWYG